MKRRHLFEFEDLPWFPSRIRNYVTDFLRTVAEKFNVFGPVVPIVKELIERYGDASVVDLASGSGGQWSTLLPQLISENDTFQLKLTDKFPNIASLRSLKETFPDNVIIESEAVEASQVPEHLSGVRTMFLSLHHFRPDLAIKIMANTVEAGVPIAFFEAQQRDVEHVLRFCLSPIMVLLLTPFVRPFSIGRLVFTYIVPIVPAVVGWDGVVSVLRTYTSQETEDMARSADPFNRFVWRTDLLCHGQQTIQVLLGYPETIA